ncbi:MAG: class II aldolase/adducin family protein [Lachnospiraceae bacterium]|nr:class II aldolase/adducin family protein [Lachnospiraceae bacterium]
MSQIKQELKQKTLEMTYLFYDMGLSTSLDSGDISLRDPETDFIYIDPRPSKNFRISPNWRCITVDDIVVMDMDGHVIDGGKSGDRMPTVEAPMHLAIYKSRPDAYGIVHSHALYSGVFAACGMDIPAALVETQLNAKGDILCAEYGKVSSQILADNIAKALGKEQKAALLRQHGAVYIGKDIEDAFTVAEYVEKGAQTTLLAWSAGMKLLPPLRDLQDILDETIWDIRDEI